MATRERCGGRLEPGFVLRWGAALCIALGAACGDARGQPGDGTPAVRADNDGGIVRDDGGGGGRESSGRDISQTGHPRDGSSADASGAPPGGALDATPAVADAASAPSTDAGAVDELGDAGLDAGEASDALDGGSDSLDAGDASSPPPEVACGSELRCKPDELCVLRIEGAGPVETRSHHCTPDPCEPAAVDCRCGASACEAVAQGRALSCVPAAEGDGADLRCQSGGICASPDTPIATPHGEQPIASLHVGDLVYSRHRGELVAVPLLRVVQRPVHGHAVTRLTLSSGRVLEISAPHPTADGRRLGDLSVGEPLGEATVVATETVPYAHARTYDILPDSDSATYVAAGVLIGSTLASAGPP